MPNTLASNLRALGLLYEWGSTTLRTNLDPLLEGGVLLDGADIEARIGYLRSRALEDELSRREATEAPTLSTLNVESGGRAQRPFAFHTGNPFLPETRLRNWLMYQLARELGLRRSELLALYYVDAGAVLSVRRRPNDRNGERRRPAYVKRGERDLPTAPLVQAGLRAYFTTPPPAGRRGVRTPFLFVANSSGAPLSLSSMHDVVKIVARSADVPDLSWHTFRHAGKTANTSVTWRPIST